MTLKRNNLYQDDSNVFILIIRIITWGLFLFAIGTFLLVTFDIIKTYKPASFPWRSSDITTFLTLHKDFYGLYGGAATLILAFIAIEQYINSNTLRTIDFFYEKVGPSVHSVYNILTENGIVLLNEEMANFRFFSSKPYDFSIESLNQNAPKIAEQLKTLYSNNLKFWSLSVFMQGNLDAFATKILSGLINKRKTKMTCSVAYCQQIEDLYPVISLFRSQDKSNSFNNSIILYNMWCKKACG